MAEFTIEKYRSEKNRKVLENVLTAIVFHDEKEIVIPEGVEGIDSRAFRKGYGVASVVLPKSLKWIGCYAFNETSIDEINIPENVYSIYATSFDGNRLKKIVVDHNNPFLSSGTNNDAIYDKEGKKLCFATNHCILSDSVTSISDHVFADRHSLSSIIIPNTVTQIGCSSFIGCSSLQSIAIPDSVTRIGELAFCLCSSLSSVIMSHSVEYIGKSAFEDCDSLKEITLPVSVVEIGEKAFPKNKSFVINYEGSYEQWRKVKRAKDLKFDKHNPYIINFLGAAEEDEIKQYHYIEQKRNTDITSERQDSPRTPITQIEYNTLRNALLLNDNESYSTRGSYCYITNKVYVKTGNNDILLIARKDSVEYRNLNEENPSFFCYKQRFDDFDLNDVIDEIKKTIAGNSNEHTHYIQQVKLFCEEHGIVLSDIVSIIEEHQISAGGKGKCRINEVIAKVVNYPLIKVGCSVGEVAKQYKISEQAVYSHLIYSEMGKPHFFEYRVVHDIKNNDSVLEDFIILKSHKDTYHLFKETEETIRYDDFKNKKESPLSLSKYDLKIGSNIHFGSIGPDLLSWTVLSNDDKEALLLQNGTVVDSCYSYIESTDFRDCITDGAVFNALSIMKAFNDKERSLIKICFFDSFGNRFEYLGNEENDDLTDSPIFFLSSKEYDSYKHLIPMITKSWWLCTPDISGTNTEPDDLVECDAVCSVNERGELSSDYCYSENGCRIALIVDLNKLDE